jgi:hypothetical protein
MGFGAISGFSADGFNRCLDLPLNFNNQCLGNSSDEYHVPFNSDGTWFFPIDSMAFDYRRITCYGYGKERVRETR